MRISLLFLVLPVVGCGGFDWNSRFAGTLTSNTHCNDGSGGVSKKSAYWLISESGDLVSISTGDYSGACDPVQATNNNDSLTIVEKSCLVDTKLSWTVRFSGTIAATGANIIQTSLLVVDVWNTGTDIAICSDTLTGTLSRLSN